MKVINLKRFYKIVNFYLQRQKNTFVRFSLEIRSQNEVKTLLSFPLYLTIIIEIFISQAIRQSNKNLLQSSLSRCR